MSNLRRCLALPLWAPRYDSVPQGALSALSGVSRPVRRYEIPAGDKTKARTLAAQQEFCFWRCCCACDMQFQHKVGQLASWLSVLVLRLPGLRNCGGRRKPHTVSWSSFAPELLGRMLSSTTLASLPQLWESSGCMIAADALLVELCRGIRSHRRCRPVLKMAPMPGATVVRPLRLPFELVQDIVDDHDCCLWARQSQLQCEGTVPTRACRRQFMHVPRHCRQKHVGKLSPPKPKAAASALSAASSWPALQAADSPDFLMVL